MPARQPVTQQEPRKTLEKKRKPKYSTNVGNLACQLKEVTDNMASHKTVKGNLYDDKGTWVVRARVFDPSTEKVRQRTKTTGFKVKDSTKRRAESAMRDIVLEWEREANAVPVKCDPLFSDYIHRWLDRKATSKRANTVQSYRDYATLHILPALGPMKIRQMTLQHLQIYYAEKLKSLSVNTLKKHHVVISGALLDAVRDNVISVNFADYVEFPTAKKFEGKAYTAEQVASLLQAVEKEGEPIRSAVTLAVCYGLRRSEICGLRWADIDFERGTLTVRNTRTQYRQLIIDAEQTKTRKSQRTIALIASTIPYLTQLKQARVQAGISCGKVCTWPDGRPVLPNYITVRAKRIMEKYGLEHVRLHDLRHTAATLLATVATPKQVQEFLGHGDISTTMNIYAHLLDADRRATSDIMDTVLKGAASCSEKCSEMEPA